MVDKRELLFRLLGKDDASPAFKKVERSAADLGDEFTDTSSAADKLDKQIVDVEKSLKDLAVQFANTGDDKFIKSIREGERELRKLNKASKLIGKDFGSNMAEETSVSFSQRIGPLIASGPGPAIAGTVFGAAMAPTLGAAVAGAIVGGSAIGGVVGGLKLAARHPDVQAAGKTLADEVMGDLEKSAGVFVGPTLQAIQIVRDGFRDIKPELDNIFGDSSRFLVPLTKGAVEGAQSVIRGIADAVSKAEPVITAISRGFVRVGDAVGEAFTKASDDADEAASAIDDVTNSVVNLVRVTSELVHFAAQVKKVGDEFDVSADKARYWLEDWMSSGGVLEHFNKRLDLTADGFKAGSAEAEAFRNATTGVATAADFATLKAAGMTDAEIAAADASGNFDRQAKEAARAAKELADKHKAAADAAKGQVSALDELAAELQAQTDPTFAVIDAQGDLAEAQKDYNEAVKEHGRKSPEAQEALRKMAAAAITLQGAIGNAAGTFDGKLSPSLRATLKAAGLTKGEIDALERQFKEAKAAGEAFAKNYKATVTVKYREEGRKVPIHDEFQSGIGGRASGGPIEAGTPYIVGEEGPELITPTKDGWVHDAQKTASILQKSAVGGMTHGSVGGTGGGQRIVLDLTGADEEFKRFFRSILRTTPDLVVAG